MTKTIRAAVICALSMTFAAAPMRAAQPGGYYLYDYTYYTDASHSQVVGGKIEHCDQYASEWGDATPYYTRVRTGYFSYSGGCIEY